jgi:hypothetical protein|tara:strand:+ start:91 stop:507 length:417 start_codon:yes stop_codon:yes gene_type:complete
MADKDIPDFMRGFDITEDWGMTPVSSIPKEESKPTIDKKDIENLGQQTNLEISKVKNDVSSIKSMMNEIMQIVAEKDTITKEISNADIEKRFKDIEKIVLPFLYNLSKSEEPYIHWPNRGPIIKTQIENLLKLTRGNK